MSDPILDKLDAKLKPRIDALQASEKNVFDDSRVPLYDAIADLQSRLTVAETRVKELEKCERRMNWILANRCSFYYQSLTIEDVDEILLRAELDKLKGTK